VNQLAAAQQLACLNGAGGSDSGSGSGGAVADGSGTNPGAGERRRFLPSQQGNGGNGRQIERSSASDARSGFRSARPTRGRSMPWTLTIEVPSSGTDTGTDTVKGSKTSGSVKVHNQFAGLDVDM
jgi:hypothetical protein